jgi:hypothetical protein
VNNNGRFGGMLFMDLFDVGEATSLACFLPFVYSVIVAGTCNVLLNQASNGGERVACKHDKRWG